MRTNGLADRGGDGADVRRDPTRQGDDRENTCRGRPVMAGAKESIFGVVEMPRGTGSKRSSWLQPTSRNPALALHSMTPDQLYKRRRLSTRHELRLLIAGVFGVLAAVVGLLAGQIGVAVGLVVLSVVAFGLARVFVVLEELSDQLDGVERRLHERAGPGGEGASKSGPGTTPSGI